ncbi:acyltransferase [Paenibacillus apiarius]|uniref:acyltransferase n=1 Tax=Paenibacillus apiarius TaxID=46240 RepID=UPI003B3BCF19
MTTKSPIPSGKKERIDELTIMRALAFFAIVLQHSIGEYIYRADILPEDAIMLGMLYHFTRYGTLTFVFLSTVILFHNYDASLDYGRFVKRRAQSVLVPFAVWTLVYGVFSLQGQLLTKDGWVLLSKQFLVPTYGYQLWFIPMIFQLYLLYPLLVRFVQAMHERLVKWFGVISVRHVTGLLLGLGAAYAGLMYWSYYKAAGWAESVGGIGQVLAGHRTMIVVFYFFYIALGIVCALHLQRWRHWVQQAASWNLWIFAVCYILIGYDLLSAGVQPINLNISTYLKPTVFVLIVAQMLLIYAIALHIQKRGGIMQRFLQMVGTYSFGGYLAHALVLALVSQFTRKLPLEGLHLIATVLTFVVVAAISLVIARWLQRSPFAAVFIGAKRRKASSAEGTGNRRSVASSSYS